MTNNFPKYWKIPLAILFAFTIKATPLYAQIEIEPAVTYPFTPKNLIENVFLGDGVKITNIQFNGEPRALGYFSHGMNEIGFEEGLLLTTGEAFQADRPNVNEGLGAENQSTAVSPELEALSSFEVKDVLEYVITFIPTTDSVEFKYRFASEEYPEFSIDCFHDVFGFFIYGPGIAPEGQNMAIVPGTNLPVSVNTIHPMDTDLTNGANCPTLPPNEAKNEHLYNDNAGSQFLEYDGFTNTLYAKSKVTPCQEYTLKLVIADVRDGLYDSAVFLESRSFSSSNFETNLAGIGLDGSIVEGCSGADLVFSIPAPRTEDYEINFVKIGTATVDEDFNDFPNSVVIPAGELSASFSIEALKDDEVEANDSIGIEIQIAQCLSDTIWIPIKDAQLELPDLGDDLQICAGDSVQLLGISTNGAIDSIIPFNIQPTDIGTQIKEVQEDRTELANDEPSLFTIEVKDIKPAEVVPGLIHSVCININHARVNQLDVFLQSPSGRFIELTTDNGTLGNNHYEETCFKPVASTKITDGEAPFTGDFLPEGNFADFYGNKVNGTWTLIVRDDTGIGGSDPKGTMLHWSINFNNDYRVNYEWEQADSMSCIDCPNPSVFPAETTKYVIKATDSYGCSASNDITVNVQQPLGKPEPTCGNVSKNAITVEWRPVVGALSYDVNVDKKGWEPANSGNLQHKITGLDEGQEVSVDVRANSSGTCSESANFVSCRTAACVVPSPEEDSLTNVSCNGGSDGQITISTPIDAYFILGNDTSQLGQTATFDALPQGTYKIHVFESTMTCSDSLKFTINEPTKVNLQILDSQPLTCFGVNDGLISVEGSGGEGAYTYSWTNLADSTFTATDLTSINTLTKGEYDIIVRDTNDCTDQKFVTISEPPAMILDSISNDESCFNNQDGSISVNANPIYNNLTFNWDNGEKTAAINNLSSGNYTVTVRNDAAGCEEKRSFTINTPPAINLTEVSTKPESCTNKGDGSITVLAEGGMGGFNYAWNDDQNQTAATATNLHAENYVVIAMDETGCTKNLVVMLDALTDISIDTALQGVSCFGRTDGQVALRIAGGTPNYAIEWSDNEGQDAEERTNLAAGDYQVIVSDLNNCSTTLDFTITDKAEINLRTTPTLASCNGSDGSITVAVVDGIGNYSYQWVDDATRTSSTAENLPKGDYTITVLDEAGCSSTATITLEEKEGVQLVTSATPILCAGETNGTARVEARGGIGAYQYQWNDLAKTNQSTAQNLAAGDYTVVVIDDLGCEASETVTIVDNSIAVNLRLEKSDISCFGMVDGQITSKIADGISNLNYQWSNGQTSPNLSNLPAADYELVLTDANNCEHTESISISEPEELFVETMLDSISCPGDRDGVFRMLPTGGTAPYSYSVDGNRYSPSSEFSNLRPGKYEPAFRDANNCVVPIEPFELAEALPLSITLDNLKLEENEPTEINPIINNGKGEITYIWSGHNLTDLSCTDCPNPLITPTNAQLYTLQVIDEVGCEADARFRVLVEKNRKIYVPTGFSPNLDGINDKLTVHGVEGTEILSFKIFDRWGELVFSGQPFMANDESAGWDGNFRGKPMTTNVFAWIVEARFTDGTVKMVKGNSTLIR